MARVKKAPKVPQKRGAQATQAIFEAALDFAARFGLDAVTVEGLSAHLGIAKTTIYRRWPNVSVLLTDAVLSEVTRMASLDELATARETFGAAMKRLVHMYTSPKGEVVRALLGRAQLDAGLVRQIEDRWVEPRREIARDILHRAKLRGELKPDVDADILLDCLYGPIYHRLLVPYKHARLDSVFVDRVLNLVFDAIELKPTRDRQKRLG